MEIHYLKKETYPLWDSYVDNHEKGVVFHKSLWKDFFESYFHKKTFFLYAAEKGVIRGILPIIKVSSLLFGSNLVSFPHFDHGGLIADSPEAMNLLINEGKKVLLQEKCESVEMRMDTILPDCDLEYKTEKVSYIRELPDCPEVLLKQFKSKLRNRFKRPLQEQMYFKSGGIELLDAFYKVFAVNMRDLGSPVYAKSFFKKMAEAIPDNYFISIVFTKDHQPAAASFCIGYKDKVDIPWASSLRKYNKFSTNTFLYYQVLCEAIKRKYKLFDFGRCSKGASTEKFKKQWDTTQVQLYWYYIQKEAGAVQEDISSKGKYQLAVKIWSKLPVWATKFLGPMIIKNLNS